MRNSQLHSLFNYEVGFCGVADFYSKGNRVDSRCKPCVKSTKKSKYVAKEQVLRVDSLFKIFELISELEVLTLHKEIQRLVEEIKLYQLRQIRQ